MVYDKFRERIIKVYRDAIRDGSMTKHEKIELSPAEYYALKLEEKK